jgi:large subunit ribosomal protein L31
MAIGASERAPKPTISGFLIPKEKVMKAEIHPNYEVATITCACGNVIHTRATKKSIRVEICNQCHPFFTGEKKLLDTAGRIDKFKKRYAKGK